MTKSTKKQTNTKGWNIKLQVSIEEERKIKKDAIDYDLKVAEYIKQKLLDRLSTNQISIEGKSA